MTRRRKISKLSNLDLQAGVATAAVAVVALLVRVVAPSLHPQTAEDLAQVVIAAGLIALAAFVRWVRRPADGDPSVLLTVAEALDLAGTRQLEDESDADALARTRYRRAWIPLAERAPLLGDRVLVWIPGEGEDLVRWGGDGKAEAQASHWRPLPDPPSTPRSGP